MPLVIGDGGTLNNLSNALGTVGSDTATGIVDGEIPFSTIESSRSTQTPLPHYAI